MIAFDNSTIKAKFTGLNATFSHTCNGSQRGLIVYVNHNSGNTLTGITYNGVSLSSIAAKGGTWGDIQGFYLANPASGANTVAISGDGIQENSTAVASSFTGVHQTQSKMIGAVATFGNAAIDATSSSHEIITEYSDSMVIDLLGGDSDIVTGSSVGAGQTARWSYAFGHNHVGSTEPKTIPGSVTMSWTWTNNARYGTILAEIRPPKKQHLISY